LCLKFFEGKGYSEDFIKNTYNVLSAIKENGSFTVTENEDALCVSCPNNKNGCVFYEKVKRYDKAALSALGLKPGDTGDFNALNRDRARELIPGVCPDCEWYCICGK